MGWGSCTKWCMSYWTKTTYHNENYVVTQHTACPMDQITCCKDYFLIHGNCFRKFFLSITMISLLLNIFSILDVSEVVGNSELIIALQNQGVTITDLPGIGRK